MPRSHAAWAASAVAVLALAPAALTHEDDPKILDKQPPVPGPGWRRVVPPAGSPLQSVPGGGTLEAGAGYAADGVLLLAQMSMAELDGASGGNDCWGYVSPSGREYALIGTTGGTVFVEVTSPTDPQVVGVVDGPDSLWRDVKVYQDHAYIVSEGGSGIQVVSMAGIDSGSVNLVNTVSGPGTSATHNVAIDEVSGFLYRTGGDNYGLRIYSLANPSNPSFVAQWTTRYVHDAQAVTFESGPYAGKQIVFACSGYNGGWDQTRVETIDVTNKSSIVQLDSILYPGAAYSHQGWLSPDRQHFYLGDELDENGFKTTTTYVFDVSNLSDISLASTFTNGNSAVGHNLYTEGDLIYEANYRSGLRVFDASSPTAPVEVAWFDTYPDDDGAEFNGLWSNYPYLPSGIVLGSDMERGLFIWWVGDPPITIDVPGGIPDTIAPGGHTLDVTIAGAVVPGSETLHYDAGSGIVEVPLSAQGGGSYTASFPTLPCGTPVSWFVSAESTGPEGVLWTSPTDAPATAHHSVAANDVTLVAEHDMESPSGWSVGAPGDDATTGIWTRVNPIGTAAQPEDDHTPAGSVCWVTGQHTGGSVGDNDVDDGKTTLLSPVLDLSGASDPQISYWRWYSNDEGSAPNADIFEVDVSTNGGSSWTSVEVVGPTGPEASGGWYQHSFRVADLVTPSAQTVLRFVASDEGSGSIVEAAVDDFQVSDVDCSGCDESSYCTSFPNSTGSAATIGTFGSKVVADNELGLFASICPPGQFGLFFYGPDQTETPFGEGNLCVSGGLYRFPVVVIDSFGSAIYDVDLTAPPQAGGQIEPGSTWNFQFWYRDPAGGGTGFNLSDGIEVTFCPL